MVQRFVPGPGISLYGLAHNNTSIISINRNLLIDTFYAGLGLKFSSQSFATYFGITRAKIELVNEILSQVLGS